MPRVMIGVYALDGGVSLGRIQPGGIGDSWNPPPDARLSGGPHYFRMAP